jgi:4-amino-4-deoxy-L-arabinose transferase-like glycosyltransferase
MLVAEKQTRSFSERLWKNALTDKWFLLLLLGCTVHFLGLLSPVLETDGTIYATLAKRMVLTGDYVQLYFEGVDWLDKPHFPFWITALSYHLFGIGTFGYKLPALIFSMLGIWYTYRFARLFYSDTVAKLSALVYVSALHFVLSDNDVRAEAYLTALIIAANFHLYQGVGKKNLKHLVWGALFSSFAIMTKGIFVVIAIVPGLMIHWLWQRTWSKETLRYVLFATGLVLLFILPEIISLYLQFDAHPEKMIFGKTNVSGVKFFLWDSQFGRFFNTGPIRGEGDPFFFLHTTLWAFFPWSLLFFAALYQRFRHIRSQKIEYVTLFNFLFPFLLFSLSKFQLPHYLNIAFPFMSILTAQFLVSLDLRYHKITTDVFILTGSLALLGLLFLAHYSLPAEAWIITALLFLWAIVFFFFRRNDITYWAGFSFLSVLLLYAFLNILLVPQLMHYQSGEYAADYARKELAGEEVMMLSEDLSGSFDFYTPFVVKYLTLEELKANTKPIVLFCHERFLPVFESQNLDAEVIKSFRHYHVSEPSANLLNAQTRDSRASQYLLLRFNAKSTVKGKR